MKPALSSASLGRKGGITPNQLCPHLPQTSSLVLAEEPGTSIWSALKGLFLAQELSSVQ